MALELEDLEGVAAIELGLPPGATEQRTLELVSAALGELPLIVGLPCGAVIPERLVKLAAYGAAAVTVTAPRISLPGRDGRLIAGHMLGPAVLPILLAALQSAAGGPLPLIASGGVYRPADREALLAAGACAVQLDSALWLP
jgi:dihydroorotate dehydrogenase (NAD+) catalytic subunit